MPPVTETPIVSGGAGVQGRRWSVSERRPVGRRAPVPGSSSSWAGGYAHRTRFYRGRCPTTVKGIGVPCVAVAEEKGRA